MILLICDNLWKFFAQKAKKFKQKELRLNKFMGIFKTFYAGKNMLKVL